MHKWFCQHCKKYILGESMSHLSRNVNQHNKDNHPGDFHAWKPEEIAVSNNYDGFDANPPAYVTAPRPLIRAVLGKKEPDITKEDREMLKKAGIKWD